MQGIALPPEALGADFRGAFPANWPKSMEGLSKIEVLELSTGSRLLSRHCQNTNAQIRMVVRLEIRIRIRMGLEQENVGIRMLMGEYLSARR